MKSENIFIFGAIISMVLLIVSMGFDRYQEDKTKIEMTKLGYIQEFVDGRWIWKKDNSAHNKEINITNK